jgi:hypothetical protein
MKRASIALAAVFLATSIVAEATVKPGPEVEETFVFRTWLAKALARESGKQTIVAEATDRAQAALGRLRAGAAALKVESARGQADYVLEIEKAGAGTAMEAAMPAIYSAFQREVDEAKLLPTSEAQGAVVLYVYIKSQYGNADGGKHVITELEQLAIDKVTRRLLAAMPHEAYRWNLLYRVYEKLPSAVDDVGQRMRVVAALHSGAQKLDP